MMTRPPSYKDGELTAYVYLLRSLKTLKFYIGWTANIKRRLYQHNQGETMSTKSYCPWELIGYETYVNKEEAKEREKSLKRNRRMQCFFKKRLLAAKEVVRVEKIILIICGMVLMSGNSVVWGQEKNDTEFLLNQVEQFFVRRGTETHKAAKNFQKAVKRLSEKRNHEKTRLIRESKRSDKSWQYRCTMMRIVAQMQDETIARSFIDNLQDRNNFVRRCSAEVAGEQKNLASVAALMGSLNDSDATVRANSAYSLGRLKAAKAVSSLKKSIKDSDRFVLINSIWSLGEIADSSAEDVLIEKLPTADETVKINIVAALSKMKSDKARKTLEEVAVSDSETSAVRELAKDLLRGKNVAK